MNEEQLQTADNSYRRAEQKALSYFEALDAQVTQRTYGPILLKDFQLWRREHCPSWKRWPFSGNKRPFLDPENPGGYLDWLNRSGRLQAYLERSVAYIYMRDLGKDLDSPEEQERIRRGVEQLKKHFIASQTANKIPEVKTFGLASLYRQAQKEGLETSLIWVMDKIRTVSSQLPAGLDKDQAQRKLIKIMAGVFMHQAEAQKVEETPKERTRKLDEAIRLGYAYGLTYPFIDDLLDADVLSEQEKEQYSELIRRTLVTGMVPELGQWQGQNRKLVEYIHGELREAYEYIKGHQQPETLQRFFEESYVFFNAQELDRNKTLANPHYENKELYIPIILKAATSRTIVRLVIGAPKDQGFEERTFYYGIYNQLADDLTDLAEDMEAGAVTPYTYYLKYHQARKDLINPFELYWTVIANLIHRVYHSHRQTCDVILNRAINSLKRYKKKLGEQKYQDVMAVFKTGDPELNQLIRQLVEKAENVDFFDKLLRDQLLAKIKNERQEREQFSETVNTARAAINGMLKISTDEKSQTIHENIIEAANYSLEGDGKRLRPIIAWAMGINEYGLKLEAISPLLRSLEYMHTASLIYDDLPSQDNASTRRGRTTLHQRYNTATAELTALFMTQRAMAEQASLTQFNEKTVMSLMRYSAGITEKMCQGQGMDLGSRGKPLTKTQLDMMAYYKTGMAFEASLVMPAMLAQVGAEEISGLKAFAYHVGIAFQIKDDLLDVEGDPEKTGKTVGLDEKNRNATYVSIMGLEAAKKELWEQYCCAAEVLKTLSGKTAFLKQLLNYIVHRDY